MIKNSNNVDQFILRKYQAIIGKKPSHLAKEESLIDAIEREILLLKASGLGVPTDDEIRQIMAEEEKKEIETIVDVTNGTEILDELKEKADAEKKEEVVEEIIEEKEGVIDPDREEQKRMYEAWKINTRQGVEPELPKSPCIIDGKPMFIVNNEYIPYDEGMAIYHQKMIEFHKNELKKVKS